MTSSGDGHPGRGARKIKNKIGKEGGKYDRERKKDKG